MRLVPTNELDYLVTQDSREPFLDCPSPEDWADYAEWLDEQEDFESFFDETSWEHKKS